MHRNGIANAALLCSALLLFVLPAAAQRAGNDTAPGDSCAGKPTGAVQVSPDPSGSTASAILVCDGTNWQAGGLQVGNDAASCTAPKNGTVRYVSGGSPPWQYCDGGTTSWIPFRQPRCTDDGTGECFLDATRSNDDPDFTAANIALGVNILGVTGMLNKCTAPSDCPSVGDVCSDGSLFAGLMLYQLSCEALYVTDNNQSSNAAPWKNATGTDDIIPDDTEDGRSNQANRSGTLSDFPAFDLCESNTYHGKSDWYLPARDELHLLWKNMAAIDANAAGAFSNGTYWTSTEYDNTNPYNMHFGSGGHYRGTAKTDGRWVRCVRR